MDHITDLGHQPWKDRGRISGRLFLYCTCFGNVKCHHKMFDLCVRRVYRTKKTIQSTQLSLQITLKPRSQRRRNRHRTGRTNTSRNRRNRRLCTMRAHLPRHSRGDGCRTRNLFSPDQHRNDRAGTQLKGPVSNNPQNRRDFTRMRGNRHKRLLLGGSRENLPQSLGTANILRATRLSRHAIPQLILLGEPMLNGPVRE